MLDRVNMSLENQRLFEAQKIISEYIDTLNHIKFNSSFSKIIDIIFECKGKIITTGIGKAGLIIKKFSSTLCSLGFPSCYLHPAEASHGDLGIIQPDDILFVASVSGKTREILETIDLARQISISKVIGITSHPDSPIRKKADLVLDMGIIQESGHLKIVPTSSMIVMMTLTDCLALVMAKEKNITLSQYAKYHHGGYIGATARGDNIIK